jgi:uncharacterized protein
MTHKNPIGWFEIFVNDIEKAKEFYGNIFDWQFKLSKALTPEYWMIYTGENSVGGGFMKKANPSQSGQSVILYIETDDIESVLANVEKHGGKIETKKTLISETSGYFGMFRDIDNNLIGLWSKK